MLSVERKGRVTASLVGAILGLSPHMTRKDAMKTMLGISTFTGNVATDYGHMNENNALLDFSLQTGLTVEPSGFVICDKYEWLGATPDGVCSDGYLIEIKCPFGLRNESTPVFKSIHDQPHYYAQVQIQMFVTGIKKCHFFQWSNTGNKHEVVEYDAQWIEWNLPEIYAFYREYLGQRDRDVGQELVAEYDEIKQRMNEDEARLKEIMEELVKMTGEKGGRVCGERFLSQVERKGSVSYAKVVKEHLPGLDLTPYTGNPTKYWVLK